MKLPSILAAIALSTLALTGCASTGSEGPDGGGVSDGGGVVSPGSPGRDEGMVPPEDGGQSVITTASVFLTDIDPAAVGNSIESRVSSLAGRIDGRSVTSNQDGETTWVSLTVRIPSESLDEFLGAMDEFGTVQSLNQFSTDVTLIVTDYEARISSLHTSIKRLEQMLGNATTTSDLIAIETALAERQAQLESLDAEMRYYRDQIDLSTIQIDIGLPASATDPVPDDFWSGVVAGWNGLLAFLGGIVIAIGVVIPWLPLVAILTGLVWWLVRRMARGNRARKASTTTASSKTSR